MCVDHMIANDQNWPESWDDLKDCLKVNPSYIRFGLRGTPNWTLSELEDRVEIDWSPDLESIRSDAQSKPVIWILDHSEREFQANLRRPVGLHSPNEIVRRHLALVDKLSGVHSQHELNNLIATPIQVAKPRRQLPYVILAAHTLFLLAIAYKNRRWRQRQITM